MSRTPVDSTWVEPPKLSDLNWIDKLLLKALKHPDYVYIHDEPADQLAARYPDHLPVKYNDEGQCVIIALRTQAPDTSSSTIYHLAIGHQLMPTCDYLDTVFTAEEICRALDKPDMSYVAPARAMAYVTEQLNQKAPPVSTADLYRWQLNTHHPDGAWTLTPTDLFVRMYRNRVIGESVSGG